MTEQDTTAEPPKATQYIAVAPDHGFYECNRWNASLAIKSLVRRVDRDTDLRVVLYHAGDEFEIDCFSIRSAPLKHLGEHVIPAKVTKALMQAEEALDDCLEKLWGDNLYDYEA